MNEALTAALEYAQLGFRVLPLKPGTKVPDLRHWPEEASTSPEVVRRHFELSQRRAKDANLNVGIVTGDGLAVVDIDTHHGGEIPSWLDTKTAAVKTPSGGLHYYYSVVEPVPNSVSRLAPGVDVRGERGQVAAPPSVIIDPTRGHKESRPGGRVVDIPIGRYVWLNDLPIARIEANRLIPEDLRKDYSGVKRTFEYRDDVAVGGRNNYLTSLAGYLFAQGESATEVLAALRTEVEHLDFSPREGEVESIVRSIARYH
jgi:hypothetical protein